MYRAEEDEGKTGTKEEGTKTKEEEEEEEEEEAGRQAE